MHFLIIFTLVGSFLLLLCAVAFIAGRLHPEGYEASPQQIRAELQEIIDGHNPYAWDDFTSVGPLKDLGLEAIRKRCAQLPDEFPPQSKGQLFGPAGIEVIRAYLTELSDEKA
jgi:hypothetical protein